MKFVSALLKYNTIFAKKKKQILAGFPRMILTGIPQQISSGISPEIFPVTSSWVFQEISRMINLQTGSRVSSRILSEIPHTIPGGIL